MMPVVPPLLELQNSHSAPGSTAFATPDGPANGGQPETSRVARTSSAMLSFHHPQLAEASNALHPLQQSYRLFVISISLKSFRSQCVCSRLLKSRHMCSPPRRRRPVLAEQDDF